MICKISSGDWDKLIAHARENDAKVPWLRQEDFYWLSLALVGEVDGVETYYIDLDRGAEKHRKLSLYPEKEESNENQTPPGL